MLYRENASPKKEEPMRKLYSLSSLILIAIVSVLISGAAGFFVSICIYTKPEHCISYYQLAAARGDELIIKCDTANHDMTLDPNGWMHCICKNK